MLPRRLPGGQIAKIKCLSARRARLRTPPIPVIDDGLDGDEMFARGCERWRESDVNCAGVESTGQEIFLLQRARRAVRIIRVEPDVHASEIDRAPNEPARENAIDVTDYIEIVGNFAVDSGRCPQLA